MNDKNAEEVLDILTDLFLDYADELSDPYPEFLNDEFVHGELTMIVEALEVIQTHWEKAETHRLNFDIEKKFPV